MQALGYFFMSMPYLVGAVLGLLLPMAVAWAVRTPAGGLTLVTFGYIADSVLLGETALKVGISLFLPDVTVGLVALAGGLRWLNLRQARLGHWALYLLLAVFAVNLVHGLVVFKTAAGPSARPTFYALMALFYMTTFALNTQTVRALFNTLLWAALLFLLVASYRGVVVAANIRELLPPSGSYQPAGHSPWRVIVSADTLLIAQAAVSLWACVALSPGWRGLRGLAPIMVIGVVALQHRSVWLAALAGYATHWMSPAKRLLDPKHLLTLLALVVVLGAAVGLAARGGDGAGLGGDIARSATDAVQLKGTAGERLGSWQQLVKTWSGAGPRHWLVGQPFGTSFDRFASDDLGARKISYQPHNFYVELLIAQGGLGLFCFLALAWSGLGAAWKARHDPEWGTTARWLLAMQVFQLSYYLTYGVDYMQTLFLGLALVLGGELKRRTRVASQAPAQKKTARAVWARGRAS
jgi:hypothetical protein